METYAKQIEMLAGGLERWLPQGSRDEGRFGPVRALGRRVAACLRQSTPEERAALRVEVDAAFTVEQRAAAIQRCSDPLEFAPGPNREALLAKQVLWGLYCILEAYQEAQEADLGLHPFRRMGRGLGAAQAAVLDLYKFHLHEQAEEMGVPLPGSDWLWRQGFSPALYSRGEHGYEIHYLDRAVEPRAKSHYAAICTILNGTARGVFPATTAAAAPVG